MPLFDSPTMPMFSNMPETASLAPGELQGICDAWVATPTAREFAVTQIVVYPDLSHSFSLNLTHAVQASEEYFFPIDDFLSHVLVAITIEMPDGTDLSKMAADLNSNGSIRVCLPGLAWHQIGDPVGRIEAGKRKATGRMLVMESRIEFREQTTTLTLRAGSRITVGDDE
jgi:hypothetical protein